MTGVGDEISHGNLLVELVPSCEDKSLVGSQSTIFGAANFAGDESEGSVACTRRRREEWYVLIPRSTIVESETDSAPSVVIACAKIVRSDIVV